MPQEFNLFAELEEVEQRIIALDAKVTNALTSLNAALTLLNEILTIIQSPTATSLVLTLNKPVPKQQ